MNDEKEVEKRVGEKFVDALQGLEHRHDRGRLADLRKGLSVTTEHHAWPTLGALGGFHNGWLRPVFQLVGALFAIHPRQARVGNIGVTGRHLRREKDLGKDDPMDRRFRRLLACADLEDVRGQLPGFIKLAKANEVPVDYESLFEDLQWFDRDPQRVKIRWAERYFGVPAVRDDANSEGGV
jgi:CRISPR type I-E-associated protein CasB/Cse2